MNAPEIRARTSRKAYNVPISNVNSVPILGDASEDAHGVCAKLLQHPWHKNNETGEECRQARKRAEGGVLQRGSPLVCRFITTPTPKPISSKGAARLKAAINASRMIWTAVSGVMSVSNKRI